VPTCIVNDENNGFVRPGARVAGEGIEDLLEQWNVDAVGHPPFNAARRGLHEAVEIEPFVFVSADGDGPLSAFRPYPAQNGLEAKTMFVERPDFYRASGMSLTRGPHHILQFFLKAACSVGDAAFA